MHKQKIKGRLEIQMFQKTDLNPLKLHGKFDLCLTLWFRGVLVVYLVPRQKSVVKRVWENSSLLLVFNYFCENNRKSKQNLLDVFFAPPEIINLIV